MARIKMPAARSKAQEITFEEAFHIFLTDSAARGLAEKTLKTSLDVSCAPPPVSPLLAAELPAFLRSSASWVGSPPARL